MDNNPPRHDHQADVLPPPPPRAPGRTGPRPVDRLLLGLVRYGLAVLAVLLAALSRWALIRTVGELPTYITFYPVVMLTAILVGAGPGLLATGLSAAAADYWFIEPRGSFAITTLADAVGICLFIAMGVFMCLVAELYYRARQRAAAYGTQLAVQEEQARAAVEIARQKELLAVTLASIGDGVIVSDAQGRVTFLNHEAERLTGWSGNAAQGQPLAAVFHIINEHTRKPAECPVEKVLRLGTVVGLANHTLLVAKDGREIPIDDSGAPIRQADGTVRGVVLVFRDFTERKQAADGLAQLAAIVESSDDAILSKDDGGIIRTWNAGAERLFGYRAEEVIGRPVAMLVPPERLEEETQIVEQLRAGRRVEHQETVRVAKDGRRLDVAVTVSPVKDQAGRFAGASKIIRDITARKQGEELLRATAAELARSNQDLEQFAYVASHDLQEPLRMVAGYLQLLSERYQGKLDEKADKYIAYAVDGAERMSGLIRDLLAYSRVNTRGEPLQPTSAQEALDFALRNLHSAIEGAAAVVTHDPLPVVRGDRIQLVQLFQNLIGNAVKFRSPDRPVQVCVSVRQEPAEWLFSVQDNGVGFEQQYENKLFLIFQRLHSRGQYPGTGIGLAICKRIVERHGGRIWATGTPGQGAVFSFTIPI